MTFDHCDIHPSLRVAELCPEGCEPLGANALARRLGVSRRQAERVIERLRAAQHRDEALRVERRRVPIGKGGQRDAWHVLWPRPEESPTAPR